MNTPSPFCTCKDTKCPFHPTSRDRGYSLCMAKNLKEREIPSCFFNLVEAGYTGAGYKFEDFAKSVMNISGDRARAAERRTR